MEQKSQANIADTYKQLNEAEKQATNLEKMLDEFEAKLEAILQEAEHINDPPAEDAAKVNGKGN